MNEEPEPTGNKNYLDSIIDSISYGDVIPIISNSMQFDHVYGYKDPSFVYDEVFAEQWAEEVEYPFIDRSNLARVAQYQRVQEESSKRAKKSFLSFLKKYFLKFVEKKHPSYVDQVERYLSSGFKDVPFSDIVREFQEKKDDDILSLLARMNTLSTYITTSYFDFMERALEAAGRTPRTQICFWGGKLPQVEKEHRPDRNFVPSKDQPVVYHLFGLEKYPETIVLTEDDYVDFLKKITEKKTDQYDPVLPTYLQEYFHNSTLMLLGYRLQDWDFRTLFRGILFGGPPSQKFNLAFQFKPSPHDVIGKSHVEKAVSYLEQYFEASDFIVRWKDPDSFVKDLWDGWVKKGAK